MKKVNLESKPARVLVIEDNVDDSDLLVRQLNKNNFEGHVKVIANGMTAWKFLTGEGDCSLLIAIFLDLKLPELSGVKLLERIKTRPEYKNLPVFIMTSSNDPKDLEECGKLGADGYITKPVTYLAFAKAVADLFHSTPAPAQLRVE